MRRSRQHLVLDGRFAVAYYAARQSVLNPQLRQQSTDVYGAHAELLSGFVRVE
jgi:hypothetical protein